MKQKSALILMVILMMVGLLWVTPTVAGDAGGAETAVTRQLVTQLLEIFADPTCAEGEGAADKGVLNVFQPLPACWLTNAQNAPTAPGE